MAFKSRLSSPLQVPPSAFERNVLLLDVTETRSLARATALRTLGATVQCAFTVEAARLAWKPGSHQLVMIDLSDGGAVFQQFYQDAQAASAKQAFAFYTSEPPYLSSTPVEAAATSATSPRRKAPAKPGARVDNGGRSQMAAASGRIAALRPREHSRAERSTKAGRSLSFGDAVKAAENSANGK
ncbi:MAG: hypothetical protein M3P27_05810 [Acidobacteriota bacterium]|nr:hypothetical protein [Acidobacteriota bacterium]